MNILFTNGLDNLGDDSFLLPWDAKVLDIEHTVIDRERDFIIIDNDYHVNAYKTHVCDFNQCMPSDMIMKDMLDKYKINNPKYYFTKSIYSISALCAKKGELVIKSMFTNRGMGKALVDVDKLNKYRSLVSDSDNKQETFNKIMGIDKYGEVRDSGEKYKLYDHIGSNNVYLEEKIDIAREFRLIIVKDTDSKEWLLHERFGYSLNFNKEDTSSKAIKIKVLPEVLVEQLTRLTNEIKAYTLSVDIYQDTNGEWGVIEYNTNYGVKNFNKKELIRLSKQIEKALTIKYVEIINKNSNKGIFACEGEII